MGVGPISTAALDMAAHLGDDTDAHDATAISLAPITGLGNPANVQSALAAIPSRYGPGRVDGPSGSKPTIAGGFEANAIASDIIAGFIGGGGTLNRENVIGGQYANVNTNVSNLPTITGTVANYSAIVGGYDNVANGLMSMIGGAHNRTHQDSTHGTIGGGSSNSITAGDYGTIGGGEVNTVSGTDATIAGGSTNTASGAYSFTAGQNNTVSGAGAVALGSANTVAGASAVALGQNHTAPANYSAAIGRGAVTRSQGQVAISSQERAAPGDSQGWFGVLRRTTTDATISTLGVAGGNTGHTVQDGESLAFRAIIVARESTTGDSKQWEVIGLVRKEVGSNSAFIGTPTITSSFASAGAAAWTITAVANSSVGGWGFRGTGEVGKTIQWVAMVWAVEVI